MNIPSIPVNKKLAVEVALPEVNSRSVFAAISCGGGHTLLNKFTSALDLPRPVTSNSYRNHVDKLENAAVTDCEEKMSEATARLRKMYNSTDDVDIINVPVSVDGTWQKRYGHNSKAWCWVCCIS